MRDSLKRAGHYALEAAQLLCRRPSLLLVALAMAAFSTVAGRLTAYHWLLGQAPARVLSHGVRRAAFERGLPSSLQALMYSPALSVVMVFLPTPPPTVTLDLYGLAQAEAAHGRSGAPAGIPPRSGRPPRPPFAELLLVSISFALAFALSTLISGGYLGATWRSLSEGEPRWRSFLITGRQCFWRLAGLGCVDAALTFAAMGTIVVAGLFHRGWPGPMAAACAFAVASFSLGLTRFAIIADDLRLVSALARSVSVISRDLPVALVLIVGPGIINLCLARAFSLPYATHLMTATGSERASAALRTIPAFLLLSCAAAALAAWLCAAMFLWYRDVRRQRTSDTSQATPAPQ